MNVGLPLVHPAAADSLGTTCAAPNLARLGESGSHRRVHDVELDGLLGDGAGWPLEGVRAHLKSATQAAWADIETTFGAAGFYRTEEQPYAPPTVPFDGPAPTKPQLVQVDRRLWPARYTPAAPDFAVPDITDDAKLP